MDPEHPTLNPAPYTGIQYVVIPQFESLGLTVAQQIAGAIAGTESVSQALQAGQSDVSFMKRRHWPARHLLLLADEIPRAFCIATDRCSASSISSSGNPV